MKFFHLSDLHLGKRLHEVSLLDDQKYILDEILSVIDREHPDGLLIAGDVYDKTVPSAEAVTLFDHFLVQLAERKLPTFLISGNHDSAERLAFGNKLIAMSGIHLAPVYDSSITRYELSDEHGKVVIHLLPFVKPGNVRAFYEEVPAGSYNEAVAVALQHAVLHPEDRNVLVTHQFVTGAAQSDSEEISVGGTDNIDSSLFDAFDYAALGHIHRPQSVGRETVRYCGTPLKYSFSEAEDEKSITVVELKEKGNVLLSVIPLTPLHELREIRGTFDEVMKKSFYEGTDYTDAYLHITLTDEEDVPDAVFRLRTVYKNLMRVDYDNTRTRHSASFEELEETAEKSPLTLFSEFYELQNGMKLTDDQETYLKTMMSTIWEDEQ